MASSVISTLWWSSYLSFNPSIIFIVSALFGSSTWTGCILLVKAWSFSTCFLYSSIVVAPIIWISPLARIGFKIFAASIDPSLAPAPKTMWNSSINKTTSSLCSSSPNNFLSLSSKSPRYFVPAIILARSSETIVFSFITKGTFPSTILWASPSIMAVFPTPGSPIKIGLFFVLLKRIWITLSTSSSLPITGSIFPASAISFKFLANFFKFSLKLLDVLEDFSSFCKRIKLSLIIFLSRPDNINIKFVNESSSFKIARRTSSSLAETFFLFWAKSLALSKICLTLLEYSFAGLTAEPLPILFITIDLKSS